MRKRLPAACRGARIARRRRLIFRLAALLAILIGAVPAVAGISVGKLDDLGVLQSRYADPRKVTVWLPSSYRPGGSKYSVLYMHDGQNLFDPETGPPQPTPS